MQTSTQPTGFYITLPPPRGVKFKSKAIDFSDYYQKEQIGPQSYQYKCDLCRKIETNSYHIKHHIKDHIYGENKYRCTICNDAFFYPSELVNHLTRNHIDTHPIEKIQIEEQESIVNTSDQTTAIETPTTVVTASHTQTSASEPQPSTSYASPPKRQRKS
ncbi:hypothetical protein GCM10023116_04920 [Kistimonas scapharcae]|uniref:C2H2-type domain-containing protein n=1 Tax=Kistimonas scapharcae TaxID=1036133 RepID=A0ABP8UWL1_9GAMM